MKNLLHRILVLFLALALIYTNSSFASPVRMVSVGNLHSKVDASGHQSETSDILYVAMHVNDFNYWEIIRCAGTRFGVVNWKNENGDTLCNRGIRLAGAPYGTSDEVANMFAVPDEDGLLIRRYFRYDPPEVVVDGMHLEPPFPDTGDTVDADKIKNFANNSNCTADILIESHTRTWMGLDVYCRTLAWSQRNHDDYIVWDYTIVNTGNIDMDDDIELPGQILDSLYIMRQMEHLPLNPSWGYSEWHDWIGVYPGDSIRMVYFYNIPETWAPGEYVMGFDYDDWWGSPEFISDPVQVGEAMIFMPKVDANLHPIDPQFPNNPAADDSTQPVSHGVHGPDDFEFKHHSGMRPPEDWELVYNVMKYGQVVNPKYAPYVSTMAGTYPNTYHDVPPIDRPGDHPNNQPGSWYFWHGVAHNGSGPYILEFGDSLRFVFTIVASALTKESCYEIGQGWADGSLRYYGPSHLPHKWFDYNLWQGAPVNDSANLAKGELLYSVIDSITSQAMAAQWNFDQGYSVPEAPPPPDFYVNSDTNMILLSWGNQSEDAPDFSGYKVFRALGAPGPTYEDGEFIGQWEHIYQCGGEEPDPYPSEDFVYSAVVTHQFDDTTALSNQDYYYYIVAFDEGGENDYYGVTEPLESSKWLTRTTLPVSPISGIKEGQDIFFISQAYPNPFIDKTMVEYHITESCNINISIYNTLGTKIRTLLDKTQNKGVYTITWNGRDESRNKVPSGFYFLRFEADGNKETKKLLLLR